MKKSIFFVVAMIMASTVASAQSFNMKRTGNGDASLRKYERQRLESLPYIQAFQASDGTILKSADATGWGVELFGGGDYSLRAEYYTPRAGLNVRYDGKKTSYRLGASVINREYNEEAETAEQRYLAYSALAAVNINLFTSKNRVHVLAIYAEGGYLFGKHSYKVEEEENDSEIIVRRVKHNGSGITYGGGIEYRVQFFATGNALMIRAGYQNTLDTFVNNTKQGGMIGVQLGFNFGIARNKTRAK